MFRQGAETVEAVLLSVERASPKGLALFLFGAATEPNCAQNNNPGVAHFAGHPRRRSLSEHLQYSTTFQCCQHLFRVAAVGGLGRFAP